MDVVRLLSIFDRSINKSWIATAVKRSFLIAGGTVGGLGAVFLAAPAHSLVKFSSSSQSMSETSPANTVLSAATRVPTPTATRAKREIRVHAVAAKKVSGLFVGPVVNVAFGYVQVRITVKDGKITDTRALQAPIGRSDRYSHYAIPILQEQTILAQSANIQGASGASYTSYGWATSLQAALKKAGL